MTLSEIFRTFTESQKEAIYELAGEAMLNGNYNHDLYHKTQYGMSESQKVVMDFLIKKPLMEFEQREEKIAYGRFSFDQF